MPIADIQINTYTQGSQESSSVTELLDGGYVVTWTSSGQDGDASSIYAQRYDANGVSIGNETLINTNTQSSQHGSAITGLIDGGYVLTWTSHGQDGDRYGIYVQRFDVDGASVGSETQINTHIEDSQRNPSITGLTDGGYVVSWVSYGQDGDDHGMYAQRFDADSVVVGGETKINTETIVDAAYDRVDHSISGLSDGGFVVMWTSKDTSIHAQRFDADGTRVGSETQVNAYTAQVKDGSVTELIDGGYVMTWTSYGQDGDETGVFSQRYDADGVKVGSEIQINTYTESHPVNPSVTGLTDGGYVVTWQSFGEEGSYDVVTGYDIYAQRFDADGVRVGSETRINTYINNLQWQPSVTGLIDGGYVVTWQSFGQDGSYHGVYAQRFDVDGNALNSSVEDDTTLPEDTTVRVDDIQINTYTPNVQTYSSVTDLVDGGYVVSWTSDGQDGDGYGIYAQRFDADGATVGSETQINTYTDGIQSLPIVTGLADGGYVVTWASEDQDGDGYGIYAQRYDADGLAIGSETLINTYTDSWQYAPSVTELLDGGYVVTWTSGKQGEEHGIYAQRFDADGATVGSETQINTNTEPRSSSSVTGLADGGYVVTWNSRAPGGASVEIFAQRYDVDGAKVGSETQINTYTDYANTSSSVTGLSDGGFVVTWGSHDIETTGDIHAQRFDADGVKVGSETLINTYTEGDQTSSSVTELADGGYVVTWSSRAPYEAYFDIYAQRFDVDGSRIGSETRINTDLESSHTNSSVTGLPDGGYVVTWSSSGEVYTQRFDVDGNAFTPVADDGDDTPLPPAADGVVFSDDFSVGEWYEISYNGVDTGNWQVSDGSVGEKSNSAHGILAHDMDEHAGSRDYSISADVSPYLSGWNNNAGLTFSYKDYENYYMVKWDDFGQYASRSSHKDLLLVKVVDGVEVVLDKVDHIDLPNIFKLQVGASATEGITVSIDGTEMLHAQQEHPAIGIIGLNTEDNDSGVAYDNVEVRVAGGASTSADSALAVVEHPGLTTVTESGLLDTDGTPIRILSLNDSGTVDLSDVASLVSDIDEISLSNGVIDLTNIEVSDVISMSDDDNTLVIHGESDDSVTLDANDWVQLDPTQYQSSDSTSNVLLQIDDAVDVII